MSIDTNEFMELMCRFHAAEGAEWTTFYNKIVAHITAARATPQEPTPAAAEGKPVAFWDKAVGGFYIAGSQIPDAVKARAEPLYAAPLPRQAAVQGEEGMNIVTGELFYRAMYEHEGGQWVAVEPKYLWRDAANRLNNLLANTCASAEGKDSGACCPGCLVIDGEIRHYYGCKNAAPQPQESA